MQDESRYIDMMRDKNPEGLRGVMQMHQDYVYTVIRQMVGASVEAEEATQDTFVKVYRSIQRFNGTSKFSTWLYRIAYRTALDYIKKRKPVASLDGMEVHQRFFKVEETVTRDMDLEEMKSVLEHACASLKPQDGAIVRMFYMKEMSLKEVASIVGMTEANVKIRLYRARKELKELLISQSFVQQML